MECAQLRIQGNNHMTSIVKPVVEKIHISGLMLNARVWGPPHGFPVIGMHGWLDNAATFDLIAPLLPTIRLVSVDFPGHGFSDYLPKSATYNNIDRALQILQLADALGWSKFSILGHSLGGIVGQLMAVVAPERIRKIALIDVFGMISCPSEEVVLRIQSYLQSSKHPVEHAIYPSMEDAACKRASMNKTRQLTLMAARVLTEGGMKKVPGGYAWTFDERLQLLPPIAVTNEQARFILNNFSSDCALITGSHGILHEYSMADRNIESFPNVRIYVLEGGHHLHLDTPLPVAKILEDFFKDQ